MNTLNSPPTLRQARTYFEAGYRAKARQLLIPLLQSSQSQESILLFLACCETIDEAAPIKIAISPSSRFGVLWKAARQLRKQSTDQPAAEYSNTCRNMMWDLGAEPINTTSLKQMSNLPRDAVRDFLNRSR